MIKALALSCLVACGSVTSEPATDAGLEADAETCTHHKTCAPPLKGEAELMTCGTYEGTYCCFPTCP